MVIGVFYSESATKKGVYISGCGSDNYVTLDGRKNIDNLIIDMEKIEKSMHNIRKVNNKYTIVKGFDFRNCLKKIDQKRFIYSTINLKDIEVI